MLRREEILEKISANGAKLRSFGVKELELFGSYARGEEDSKSDIDFLVQFKEGRGGFRDFSNTLNLLEELFGKRVDLVKKSLVREELKPYILKGKRLAARI